MPAASNSTPSSDNPFVGFGWRFPIIPDESGALGYIGGDDNVRQSLHLLLLTELGERVMRPEFGSKAPSLVYAPSSVQYRGLLEQSVREAITTFEPRVQLDKVDVQFDPDDESRVNVGIDYRVRQTGAKDSLVFPFYLAVGQG